VLFLVCDECQNIREIIRETHDRKENIGKRELSWCYNGSFKKVTKENETKVEVKLIVLQRE